MYMGKGPQVDREEYLLGKAVDKYELVPVFSLGLDTSSRCGPDPDTIGMWSKRRQKMIVSPWVMRPVRLGGSWLGPFASCSHGISSGPFCQGLPLLPKGVRIPIET